MRQLSPSFPPASSFPRRRESSDGRSTLRPYRSHRKHHHGFTLIEILIVLIIIGIITAVAILAIGDFGTDRNIRITAKELNMLIPYAQERAVILSTTLGLKIHRHGYVFYKFGPKTLKNDSDWQEITASVLLKQKKVAKNIRMTAKIKNGDIKIITFFPSGDITPFTIFIGAKDSLPSYKIVGTRNGIVKLQQIPQK